MASEEKIEEVGSEEKPEAEDDAGASEEAFPGGAWERGGARSVGWRCSLAEFGNEGMRGLQNCQRSECETRWITGLSPGPAIAPPSANPLLLQELTVILQAAPPSPIVGLAGSNP